MAKSTMAGAFAANIMVPAVIAFIVHPFLPKILISIWLFAHFILFIIRIFISKKLLYFSQKPNAKKNIKQYFLASLTTTSLTAGLHASIIWVIYIYQAPDLHLILMTLIIIIMAAGSLSALGSIIIAFILFVCITVIPLVILGLHHNGEMFLILSFILFGYMLLHILFGYRQYLTLRDTVFLKDTFKSIYEKSSDGIMLIKGNRFHDCNEASVKMFGYRTKEELLTTHLSKFMPKYQPDGKRSVIKMLKMVNTALKNGSHSFEWLHQKKTGEPFWTEIVLTKITLNNEELLHGVWRNIEDRKKLEIAKESANKEIAALNKSLEERVNEEVEKNREKDKQLLHQSRLAQMGEMISMIAHQWRQPLAAISATSASIELKAGMGKLDNETAQQKACEISDFSQQLSSTIDDFRNFFKPEKVKEKVTFATIIESSIKIVHAELKTNNILVQTDFKCKGSIHVYVNELQQVTLNLIKNAEDALLEKEIKSPTITIRCYSNEHEEILEVCDNAGGIPEEIIDNIFDPYFSTKHKKDGTGLGLYMSKTIIEEHCGGKLSVSNGDEGAVFCIIMSKEDRDEND